MECVSEMREERWDRVCEEDEPLYWARAVHGRPPPPFITKCCETEGENSKHKDSSKIAYKLCSYMYVARLMHWLIMIYI